MSERVEVVDDPASWTDVLASARGATFFHTAEWCDQAADVFGWVTRRYLIDIDGELFACCTFKTSNGLQAAPIGYGGLLAIGANHQEDSTGKAIQAIERAEEARITRMVFAPEAGVSVRVLDGLRANVLTTSFTSLAPDWETAWKALSGNARTAVRAAARRGVLVERAPSPAAVDGLYGIYDESMARVGATYRTPPVLLERLVGLGDEHVWLLTATRNDIAIAWGMFLRFHTTLFHWISVYRVTARPFLPVDAILGEAFRRAVAAGIKTIDLGASKTPEQIFSKSRWAPRLIPYQVVER